MSDSPDADPNFTFDVPMGDDGVPLGIEMNQVGAVTAAASSVEFAMFLCLSTLAGVKDPRVAFAAFGNQQFDTTYQMTKRVLKVLQDTYPALFGDDWSTAIRDAKDAMDRRNMLMHSTWVGSLADGGREQGTAGFAPWKGVFSESGHQVLSWRWMMQLRGDLERVALKLWALEESAQAARAQWGAAAD